MNKLFLLISGVIFLLSSCHPAKTIQRAIVTKDTAVAIVVLPPSDDGREDSIAFIKEVYKSIQGNQIMFETFSGKIDVDYENSEGKKYNVNGHLRMQKDSVIWLSVTAILGIEGLRLYITPDSIKMLDKQNKVYTAKDISFLDEMTGLPLNFSTLQNLLIGNPVFFDSVITGYSKGENTIALAWESKYIKNLLTVNTIDKLIQSSKLEDTDRSTKRNSELTYADYKSKKEGNFSEKRVISIQDSARITIKLDFKQYEFNEKLSFPFSVPKNYTRN